MEELGKEVLLLTCNQYNIVATGSRPTLASRLYHYFQQQNNQGPRSGDESPAPESVSSSSESETQQNQQQRRRKKQKRTSSSLDSLIEKKLKEYFNKKDRVCINNSKQAHAGSVGVP